MAVSRPPISHPEANAYMDQENKQKIDLQLMLSLAVGALEQAKGTLELIERKVAAENGSDPGN